MATKDDPPIGSLWRAARGESLTYAFERGGHVVEVRPLTEAEPQSVVNNSRYVTIRWPNGRCRGYVHSVFWDEFDPIKDTAPPRLNDPYSAGPNGETAGYLAGLTGNRWL